MQEEHHPFLRLSGKDDYGKINQGDDLSLPDIRACVEKGVPPVLHNQTTGQVIPLATVFTDRQKTMILAGGLLNATRNG